jgi:hypothetical protein
VTPREDESVFGVVDQVEKVIRDVAPIGARDRDGAQARFGFRRAEAQ